MVDTPPVTPLPTTPAPDNVADDSAAIAPETVAVGVLGDEPADPLSVETTSRPDRVGVLVVHGIGEQRRFEHLEEQTKKIAEALLKREERTHQKTEVTFEILAVSGSAPYQSQQDSWMGGRFPAVRALVRHGDNLKHETHLHFHEVWWADANERSTFAKQIRFWVWGLRMWSIRGKENSAVAGFTSMLLPKFPGNRRRRLSRANRAQLFMTGLIFLLSSFSVTLVIFLLKRLNFGVWSPVNTLVNYVSGVKLYTQSHRSGGGPLDGIREPPRFTIRRRMVRALVDLATADYDRWYILAHSLGTVVAFNGLMTHAHSIPNYLDERRWRRVWRHVDWIGPPRPGKHERLEQTGNGEPKREIPPRPLWIRNDEIVVYREKLFDRLKGFFTYGSPLDKFAGMWPAYVPINRDVDVFRKVKWINIFDRTDPVAAALKAYDSAGLSPMSYGYKASPVLLFSHLKYLDLPEHPNASGKKPADCVVDWLLLDRFEPPTVPKVGPDAGSATSVPDEEAGWYSAGSWTAFWRVLSAYLQWTFVTIFLAYLGVWVLRWLLHIAGLSFDFSCCLPSWAWMLGSNFLNVSSACNNDCKGMFDTLLALRPFYLDWIALIICGTICTFFIGATAFLKKDDDDPRNW
jgi:hypothetical protein